MTDEIIGYGGGGKGGGGGSRAPVEAPDSLRSRAYARLIDLICEGEVEGLATGDLKSVYLDRVPVLNADGSYNFSGVTFAFRNGTQSQTYIQGFANVENENPVNVQVTENQPVVRSISSDVYSMVRVTLAVPQLYTIDTKTGDTSGISVRMRILLQSNGGSYTVVKNVTFSGKTTSRYQRSYLIPLTGSPPWNIKVERLSEDSASSTTQNQTWWDSYTEIQEAKLRYPNSSLSALSIDSAQFSNIPVRGYDMKMLRVRVPVNYDPETRVYTGTWDGTFKIAWTDNPAWCFYDLLTNARYGLGDFISTAQVDKWALYAIGQYCDELVPDGFGSVEPRFTCNIYIQERQEAYKVLQDMASIFRGMAFWSAGQITAVQDSPSDPVALFTTANIADGRFIYSGSSLKQRHTVAVVAWNDPDDFYTLKQEYVEDKDGIDRYGVIQTEIVAVGCTSRGQANRVGKWLLYSEINETETVTFKTGLTGGVCRPGDVINVQDQYRAGSRRGGRVVSATTTAITVDNAFTPSGGVTYTFQAIMPDGTVASATVSSIVGNVITLATALPAAPRPDAVWLVTSNDLSVQSFRVVSVSDGSDGTYEVTGLKYNPVKYGVVENNLVLTSNPISKLGKSPDPPYNLVVSESLYQTGQSVETLVQLSWTAPEGVNGYVVYYERDDGTEQTQIQTQSTTVEIRSALPGDYTFSVYAVSPNQKTSAAAIVTQTIYGKTALPVDVAGFSLANISDGVAQLSWTQATDLDVLVGGFVRIRHSQLLTGATWENAVDIGPALAGSATLATVPMLAGTYMAKFIDSSGNTSLNASLLSTSVANVINLNAIQTITESPNYLGVKNNTFVTDYGGPSGLTISGAGFISDIPLISAEDSIAFYGGVASSGEYEFSNYYDLGAVYTSVIQVSLAATAIDVFDKISQRGLVSLWVNVAGEYIDDVNARLYVATTNDDPAGSPTWSAWKEFFVGQYTARAFKFKVILTSEDPTHNILLTTLSVDVDMPDRVEAQTGLVSGAGTFNVTFPNAFRGLTGLGITAENMATGDYYQIASKSVTGFSITFRNAAGTAVSRTFDYLAKGYGYLQ
jgi:predicted phage tail protein